MIRATGDSRSSTLVDRTGSDGDSVVGNRRGVDEEQLGAVGIDAESAAEAVGKAPGAVGRTGVEGESVGRESADAAEGAESPSVIGGAIEVVRVAVHIGTGAGERPEVDVELAPRVGRDGESSAGNKRVVARSGRTVGVENLPVVIAAAAPSEGRVSLRAGAAARVHRAAAVDGSRTQRAGAGEGAAAVDRDRTAAAVRCVVDERAAADRDAAARCLRSRDSHTAIAVLSDEVGADRDVVVDNNVAVATESERVRTGDGAAAGHVECEGGIGRGVDTRGRAKSDGPCVGVAATLVKQGPCGSNTAAIDGQSFGRTREAGRIPEFQSCPGGNAGAGCGGAQGVSVLSFQGAHADCRGPIVGVADSEVDLAATRLCDGTVAADGIGRIQRASAIEGQRAGVSDASGDVSIATAATHRQGAAGLDGCSTGERVSIRSKRKRAVVRNHQGATTSQRARFGLCVEVDTGVGDRKIVEVNIPVVAGIVLLVAYIEPEVIDRGCVRERVGEI